MCEGAFLSSGPGSMQSTSHNPLSSKSSGKALTCPCHRLGIRDRHSAARGLPQTEWRTAGTWTPGGSTSPALSSPHWEAEESGQEPGWHQQAAAAPHTSPVYLLKEVSVSETTVGCLGMGEKKDSMSLWGRSLQSWEKSGIWCSNAEIKGFIFVPFFIFTRRKSRFIL